MSVRIVIYEDSDHLISSLCSLFQWNKEMEVMLAKPNPSEVLKDIDEYRPDVILMDIDMPVINGIEAVTLLRSNNLNLPIIMLTIFDDSEHIYNAICAGASGYLLKNDFENIISAIKDVLNGGAPMTGSVARKVLNSFARPSIVKKENIEQLTERENEILQELVKGCSYKMIADKLELSIDTIRTHIKKIYKKLQVNSATEAIYKITNK
jgi:DNA-binding NarL/FixJ family response regulator